MTDNQDNSRQIYNKFISGLINREIANFSIFLSTLDEVLANKSQELSTNISITESNLHDIDDINDERRKELIHFKVEADRTNEFTNLLRQSFLTSLYSFMELWLTRDCYVDSNHKDGGKSYSNIKKKHGIEKARIYFITYKKSEYPFNSGSDWQWLKNFQLLRDCIIHRQGSLTGFSNFNIDPTLVKFVEREDGLKLGGIDNNQIFVEYEFCLKALQTVQRFMVELLTQ